MKKIITHELNNLALPIFPLPVFVLPGGKVRLRVFEAKYIKMLSLISSHQMFVIQLTSKSPLIDNNDWGSLVKIQDFNQGEDGILEIDIHCNVLVHLSQMKLDEHNLTFAKVKPLAHWAENHLNESPLPSVLASSLNDIMSNDTLLRHLYPQRAIQNSHWVVARWLELLPMSLMLKNQFVKVNDFSQAKDFVTSVIYK